MTKVLSRVRALVVVVAAALAAGVVAPPAGAQEEKKLEDAPETAEDLAAETAYLQAYFAEKEKRDFAAAEKSYAAVAATKSASREIVGRALLGRARCLRALKRDADADAVVAEVGEGYADVVSAGDLAVLRPSRAELTDLDSRIDMLISLGNMEEEIAEYGDRAVPYVEPELRSDVPGIVRNAATSLRLIASPAAWATVRRALADPKVAFPRQLASAAFLAGDLVDPKPAHLDALRAALAHEDPDVRWPAIQCALSGDGRVPGDVIDAILSDPVHAEIVLDGKVNSGERWGQCLVAAIASSRPALRNRALGHVKAWASSNIAYDASKYYTPFFDPPAAFLADDEALAVAVERVYRPVAVNTARPSRALLDRLSRFPEGADLAAAWMLAAPTAPDPFDPAAFAVALTHSRPGKRVWIGDVLLCDRLVDVASGPGRDKVVEVMGSHWRWGPIVGDVLKGLESRKALDAATLRHLARAASDVPSRSAVLRWLAYGGAADLVDPSGVRVRDEILVGAIEDPDPKVASVALEGLRKLNQQGAQLTFPTESVRRLLEGRDDQLADAAASSLASRGEEGLKTLAAQLRPDHPRLRTLVYYLGDAKDPRVDEHLRDLVLHAKDWNGQAAMLYARRNGDDAFDFFWEALGSSSAAARRGILETLRKSPRPLGPMRRARLMKFSFERAPGTMSLPVASAFSATTAAENVAQAARDEVLGGLTLEQQLEILRAALRSAAATDRRWAAWAMAESGGDAGWDDLLAAAEDPDGEVRELAREGLRKLEESRSELERLRSAGSARKIRERVDSLLADAKPDSRRAAIAAIVATRSADRIPDLLRLAVEDADEGVRSDARTALMSLGSSGATAAPTRETAPPEKK